MSVAPFAGVVALDNFKSPTVGTDGIQGQVPKPLAGQANYVLTGNGWSALSDLGVITYQGTWDASTNTPTLTSSVGTQGYYYVVSVAGSTNLNGITSWSVGDWAIFNGSVWEKINSGATLGTMAYQNANAVAITGGSVDNTTVGATTASTGAFTTLSASSTVSGTGFSTYLASPPAIGGTTPSTGTFTTLTAQTEVLKGTGQNLFKNTNNFSAWGVNGGTLTLSVATTDPFGGTNVYKLVANNGESPTVGSIDILSNGSVTLSSGATYTQSIYFKAAEFSAMSIRSNTSGEIFTFTIGSSPVATSGVLTPALTSVGNNWYRASWTFVAGTIGSNGRSDNWSFRLASTGDGTSGIYVSSPQLEYGSILDPYLVNTTSTVIYGTPSISFAGVSSIALDNLGNLSLQPAGTGALQAQATTSSATGGNARGANAVDWQTSRGAASSVASGGNSVIAGGYNNLNSAQYGVVSGGYSNTNNGYISTLSGGNGNTTSSQFTFAGGGASNTASNYYASAVGGSSNTSAGILNFVGGGTSNSGTANGTVTTQLGTMNGTTAVTLSGSNASIKVGQAVLGTSINFFPITYVAAISGTSLTLSQAASGSSTSTLSFYTPHGVIVGGGNNQATGSYSFIGGGGDAGTAANRNVASGDWSVVAGGRHNTASGIASFIGGGGLYNNTDYANTASGAGASVVGGIGNLASGANSIVGGGYGSTSSGQYSGVLSGFINASSGNNSSIIGGSYATTRSIDSLAVIGGGNPLNASGGMSQTGILILARQTTDATATVLASNSSAASGTNQVILPNNSAYYFSGEVVAGVTGSGDTKGWSIEGVIKRGAGVSTAALVGTPTVTSLYADTGAATWTVTALADTTNGGLKITVTGQASTTIRWVCQLRTTEMTY